MRLLTRIRTLARARHAPEPALPEVAQSVAIILDGNGRWASRRGLPVAAGHRAGAYLKALLPQLRRQSGHVVAIDGSQPFSLTKPNTSSTIEKPASLRSDGVRDHPGMPFGIIPESRSRSPGIPYGQNTELPVARVR